MNLPHRKAHASTYTLVFCRSSADCVRAFSKYFFIFWVYFFVKEKQS